MSYLTRGEKLKNIIDLCEKHEITGYQIGENTPLNASGVHRILTGEVKNPRTKTLDIILDFINYKISELNSKEEINTSLKEPDNVYKKDIHEIIADRIMEELKPILKSLKKENYQIISSLLEINKELDELRDFSEECNENIKEMHDQILPKK